MYNKNTGKFREKKLGCVSRKLRANIMLESIKALASYLCLVMLFFLPKSQLFKTLL